MVLNESLFFSKERLRDRNRFELLSFHETSLLLGLMSEVPFYETPLSYDEVGFLYNRCKAELEALHRAMGAYSLPESIDKLFVEASTFIEPMFYCASAAFWFDYIDLAPKLYQLDEPFLIAKGLNVAACCRVLQVMHKVQQVRLRDFVHESRREFRLCRKTSSPISQFMFRLSDLPSISEGDFASFQEWFTLRPGAVGSVVDPIAFHPIKARPALTVPDGRVFVPNLAMVAEQIYESPFFAISEDKAYFGLNANNRGIKAEDTLGEELERVRGACVFRDVQLFRKGTSVAQIDGLIAFGEIGILFEIKTKRLTEAARGGDEEKLIGDLRRGITDAKNQLVVSRSILLSRGYDRAVDLAKSNELVQLLGNIRNIICVSVMAHEIPSYPLLVRTIMQKEDAVDVLCLTIFDLRVMAVYLENVFDFIYYIYFRSALGGALMYETEAALLAFHLKVRLTLPDDRTTLIVDEGYSQELDADYPSKVRGEPGLRLQFGMKNVDSLIAQLIAVNDPQTFRTFSIFRGMNGESAKSLNRMLIKAKAKMQADREAHDVTVGFGKAALTIILAPSLAVASERIELLKLKRRAERRFDEEHIVIASVVIDRSQKRRDPSKASQIQLRGLTYRKGAAAHSGITVFPLKGLANDLLP